MALKTFIPLWGAALAIFLVGRCYEWGLIAFHHGWDTITASYLVAALLRDFQVALVAAVPLWLLHRALQQFWPQKAPAISSAVLTLIGGGNILLITYFSATLVPLGPEFWAYSFTEMTNTVIASGRLSFWGALLFVAAMLGLFWTIKKIILNLTDLFSRSVVLGIPAFGILALVVIQMFPIGRGPHSSYRANKLAYFVEHSLQNSGLLAGYSGSQNIDPARQYPLMHPASNRDVLGNFFKATDRPPNIVFLLVESLGGEFVGSSGQWGGFAPHLDSLAQHGLYWKNGLSLSGRTFGMVPSLLGSLPPIRHGFMDLGPQYPNHQTLISLLHSRGYYTAYFSGYDTYFDKLGYFLDYQGTDFVLNKQKIDRLTASRSRQPEQNYWGYVDKTMFNIASSILDTTAASPRLEIYHTLQTHSPFTVPQPDKYQQKFEQRLQQLELSPSQREAYRQYRSELTALLYTDEAIHSFMEAYRQREGYENTIFIITGDHWLIPVPQTTQISRYHVPLIIYSPLLKKPVQFSSVNTHANIVPSLTSYLGHHTGLAMPDSVHWIGSPLDTARAFRNIHSVPFMRNKNQLTDYLDGQYYLSDDQLFKLEPNLRLSSSKNDTIKTNLRNKLNRFKAKARYVVENNKLYPGNGKQNRSGQYNFITRYDSLFQHIDSAGLSADQQFELARQKAFHKHYETARAIARRLLMRYPDYHDVRLLLGRTYAWEGQYEKARSIFYTVLKRDSTYYDTYNALFDTEYWSGNPEAALHIINKGLEQHPRQNDFLEKKIRILATLNRYEEAREVYQTLKKYHPGDTNLSRLKKYLSK